jgi:hypothetical protein
MGLSRRMKTALGALLPVLLSSLLLACETGDETCCVGHVRGCIDEMDLCAWQCEDQGADADCYSECIFVAKNCAMECEDE